MNRENYLEGVLAQAESRLQCSAVSLRSVAEVLPPKLALDGQGDTDAASVAYGVYYDLLALAQFLSDAAAREFDDKKESPQTR